jgi:hypothetical protein
MDEKAIARRVARSFTARHEITAWPYGDSVSLFDPEVQEGDIDESEMSSTAKRRLQKAVKEVADLMKSMVPTAKVRIKKDSDWHWTIENSRDFWDAAHEEWDKHRRSFDYVLKRHGINWES